MVKNNVPTKIIENTINPIYQPYPWIQNFWAHFLRYKLIAKIGKILKYN